MENLKKALIGEFLGTYFLVFMGTGAVIVDNLTGQLTHVGVALVFGLVVMVGIYAFGHISKAHFNPAVTIAFLMMKDISPKQAVSFVITQITAAISASFSLRILFSDSAGLGETLPSGSWLQSFALEFILTFFLMAVILYTAHKKANPAFAGIAIGATIALEAMFGGPISGASMNPARSIGPALVSGHLQYLWVYVIATILGTTLATGLYLFVYRRDKVTTRETEKSVLKQAKAV